MPKHLLLGALAVLGLGAQEPDTAEPSSHFLEVSAVEKLECQRGHGSGVRISDRHVLTAQHVISMGMNCRVDGFLVRPIYESAELDLAVVEVETRSPVRIPVNCEGFRNGQRYYAVGYTSEEGLIVAQLRGTGSFTNARGDVGMNHLSILRGNIFPGQSGGPILDEDGRIVGINNAKRRNGRAIAYSRSVAETYLCARQA